jgi:hypothetical protein
MTPLTSVLVFIFAIGAVGGIEQVNQGIHRPARIESSVEANERDEWREACADEIDESDRLGAIEQIEACVDFALENGDI